MRQITKQGLAAALLLLGGSTFAQKAEIFQQFGEQQREIQERSNQAYQKDGGLGMQWQFERMDTKNKWSKKYTFDLTQYKDPAALILPGDRSQSVVALLLKGISGGKKSAIERVSYQTLNNVYIKRLNADSKNYKTLIAEKNHFEHDIWVGEYETVSTLWNDYLKADYMFYHDHLIPELVKSGYSESDRLDILELLADKQYPTSPQAMAKVIADACESGIKKEVIELTKSISSWTGIHDLFKLYLKDCRFTRITNRIKDTNPATIREAFSKYTNSSLVSKYSKTLQTLDSDKKAVLTRLKTGSEESYKSAQIFLKQCRRILMANPLLDTVELLAVRRKVGTTYLRDHTHSLMYAGRTIEGGGQRYRDGFTLGSPVLGSHNILTNLRTKLDWNCDIVKLSDIRGDVTTTPLFTAPDKRTLISTVTAHWDGNRAAFTMGGAGKNMALYELDVTNGVTKQLSPKGNKDHFIDASYLPDGNMIVMSTAIMTALPCELGSHFVANPFKLNTKTGHLRQLGLDQENSYHPTVTEDGRVMYVRYEYTDTAHYYTRVLMKMNPDGTNQREFYGSNSVWPTATFYPKQVPGTPNKFTAVVSGHHGRSHMGKLMLFDVSKGRRETDGVVQFIGNKKRPVKAIMEDQLYKDDYPIHMYSTPLSENFMITMMKPSVLEPWGLYLVDTFDNKTLIHQPKEHFLAWPQVITKKEVPPVVPSRINPESETSTIYIQDIYQGPGLQGIPRGSVKELGVFAFHYGFQGAASHKLIGIEGPWDARYILGKVPVNPDGSVIFNVPAMMPISLMPLDKDGAALQKMRSWMNPQPGEILSCVGCHETADHSPINKATMASKMKPLELQPWLGKKRPYSFLTEVQPTLDKHCISCHDGSKNIPDLRNNFTKNDMLNIKGGYSKSYTELQKHVRRQGPEGDYKLPVPMEWHVSSSRLIQMLKKGHHGVELDKDAWERLHMWIDLNVPFHGAFNPTNKCAHGSQEAARHNNLKQYANIDWNPEQEYRELAEAFAKRQPVTPVKPNKSAVRSLKKQVISGWPFSTDNAKKKQADAGATTMAIEYGKPGRVIKSYDNGRAITKNLDKKERIEFVRIPAGTYVMGDDDNYQNETPQVVTIERPFWMSTAEITNTQFQTFDPNHDSRFEDLPEKNHLRRGLELYKEDQPAARLSYNQAVQFCNWLSKEADKKVRLPTEEQWEWAARAGTDTDMWYGNRGKSFSKVANLSDKTHKHWMSMHGAPQYFNYVKSVNDNRAVASPVKSFKPNAWGLYDMIGNAEEWTRSKDKAGDRIARGGSWFDIPKDATSATRFAYNPSIRLPDLGFRIIIED